ARAHLRPDHPPHDGARPGDDDDLHVHLDVERLLQRTHLSDGPGHVHGPRGTACVRRCDRRILLGLAVRDVDLLPAARLHRLPRGAEVPRQGHRHDRHQVSRQHESQQRTSPHLHPTGVPSMTAQTVTGPAPSTGDCRPLRYLVVGAGNRCEMYLRSLLEDHADAAVLVGIGDTNPGRAEYYRAFAAARTDQPVALFDPADLEAVIRSERADRVIITTPDHTHADLI